MRKRLVAFLFSALLAASFAPQGGYAAPDYDYEVTDYDVIMVVHEDNSFAITENIGVFFHTPRHGVYRALPLVNDIRRLDGTTSRNRARIRDIEVSEPYTVSDESGEKLIRIGDPGQTVTGGKRYTVSYSYHIGRDTVKGADELYFNLIGGWDTTVDDISFTIVMPKSFDPDKLGFSAGAKGSAGSGKVSYAVNGTVITGRYDGALDPNEYLTVRLELPEGYFTGAGDSFDAYKQAALLLPILFFSIIFLIWMRHGKDDAVPETVERRPPAEYNSAEVGFIYKGKADDGDVLSLLFDLASRGYLAIEETEKKSRFAKKNGFKITRIKAYDGDNGNEELFMEGLFAVKPKVDHARLKEWLIHQTPGEEAREALAMSVPPDEVTDEDLRYSFYTTVDMIKANLNSKENRDALFEENPISRTILGAALSIAAYAVVTILPILDHYEPEMLIFALLFPLIGFSVIFGALRGIQPRLGMKAPPGFLFVLIWGLLFGGVPWAVIVLPSLLDDPMYFLTHFVGLAGVAGILILLRVMPKRTPYGNELLGRVMGFRRHLKTIEKPRMQALMVSEPEYFYEILPYAYVLGVSDKWLKAYEALTVQEPPGWRRGSGPYRKSELYSVMDSALKPGAGSMASRPSSSGSGSGSSGGGSSGGGSGGGRGGSW
ncbi:MAG: DUF2207 domain-containing protein [Clostridiales bacterium]|nr:DUF2207 domain-containing protein [Clostridiales bacterium]